MTDEHREMIAGMKRVIELQRRELELRARIDDIESRGRAWGRAAARSPEILERLKALCDDESLLDLGLPPGMDGPDDAPEPEIGPAHDAEAEKTWLGGLRSDAASLDGRE